MLTYLFLTSGLLIGWTVGANDAVNIFDTAVGSRMLKFKTAAIGASIFIILGAVLQGSGTTKTLSELGTVDSPGGAFTISLCSAVVVIIMTKYWFPVSLGQAIVGAIIGWCYFTTKALKYIVLEKIVIVWILGPIIAAIFSVILFLLVRKFIQSSQLHLIKMESLLRFTLIIVGAFGAYSFGANNIANVIGVFANILPFSLTIGVLTVYSVHILFFIGGLAISFGIFTYSKKVTKTFGGGILSLTPETAIAVVLSQGLVLFIFSSSTLSHLFVSLGLHDIPMVPISSTQVVVGSVFGIGLIKGIQNVKTKIIGNMMLGWILTPIISGIFTFFSLFFVRNVFGIKVTNNDLIPAIKQTEKIQTINMHIPFESNSMLISAFLIVLVVVIIYFLISQLRNKQKTTEKEHKLLEQMQYSEFQKALSEIEVNTVQIENTSLVSRLEEKRNELVTYSLNIGEQRQYLESISNSIQKAIETLTPEQKNIILNDQLVEIKQKMSFSGEVDKIYKQAEQVHYDFMEKLNNEFPNLSTQEKRLMVLLRIGLSSKEIAPLLNISIKSVEISRYRLRKKLNLDKDKNLVQFTKTM